MTLRDITGQKFGRLTALEWAGSRRGGGAIWRFRCECGSIVVCDGANVRNGRTKSCGCLKKMGPVRHGMSHTTTHNVWVGMRQRCQNPNSPVFSDYGGRGIRVCDRWQVFDSFLADMGEAPPGMSIERVNNNGNYEPGNCVWATPMEQMHNRRTTTFYSFNGETMSLQEWGRSIGVPYPTMWHRYKIGKRGHDLLAPLRVTIRRRAS